MVEVLLKERSIKSVDLVDDVSLDPTTSSLVVQHLGEDVQLSVGQLGLRGFDQKELGETEGWDHVGSPLQISCYHGQILGEVGRIEFGLSENLSTLGAARIGNGVVEL